MLTENPPLSHAEAWEVYDEHCAEKRIARVEEPDGLGSHWKRPSAIDVASLKKWMDAYPVAFAMAGGYQLVTTDEDFRKYEEPNVRVLGVKGK